MSHVLGPFSKLEEPCVDAVLDAVLDGLGRIQRRGMEQAGNWINAYRPQSSRGMTALRHHRPPSGAAPVPSEQCVEGVVAAGASRSFAGLLIAVISPWSPLGRALI